MKFYGVGQVWDKKKKKVIINFEGSGFDPYGYTIPGYYSTDKEDEIELLKSRGYETNFDKARNKIMKEKKDRIKKNKLRQTLKSMKEVEKETG